MDIHSVESHMEIYCEVFFFLSWVIILGLEGLLQLPQYALVSLGSLVKDASPHSVKYSFILLELSQLSSAFLCLLFVFIVIEMC